MAEKNIVQTESDTGQLTNIATTDVAGIASFNTDDFTVDENGKVSSKQKVGAIQYIGKSAEFSEMENYLYWDLDALTSPKKIKDVKLGDLILYCGDEYNVTDNIILYPGDIFVVESATSEAISTSTVRFSSMRGAIGPQGVIGVTPDVTATASADQTIGTATVDVVKTGTKEEVNFDFAFSGIKGERGDKGEKGDNLYVEMSIEKGLLYLLQDSIMNNDFLLEDGYLYVEDE